MQRTFLFLCLVFLNLSSSLYAEELIVSQDTLWAGEIELTGDVLVLPGATLTIEPGTTIRVHPSENTRTEPQFISSYTEITVRGTLKAEGTMAMPITFIMVGEAKDREWAGV